MAIEITKTFLVKAAPSAVWEFLVDPQRVAKCLPGAAVTDKLDDKTWAGTMTVKVGPVTSSYKGKVVFERLDAATRSAEIVAQGTDVRGKGGADLRLTSSLVEKAPGETEVTTVSKVNITGILAQMGRGMIQDVSDQMFKGFSERMRAELESPAQAQAPPIAAATGTATATETGTATGTATTTANSTTTATPEALDLGAVGGKVAGKMLKRAVTSPLFWVGVFVGLVLARLFR